jgi:hypothetical protein
MFAAAAHFTATPRPLCYSAPMWGQAFSLPPAFQPAFFALVARRRAEARRQAESLTPQARQRFR